MCSGVPAEAPMRLPCKAAFAAAVGLGLLIAAGVRPLVGQPDDPERLRDDVRILKLIARLGLTSSQMRRILPELDKIQQAIAKAATEREKLRGDYADALAAARQALVEGKPLAASVQTRLDRLAQASRAVDAQMEEEIAACEARIERSLAPQQLDLIETAAQQEARLKRIEELEGETTAAGYVVKKLTEIREMLPDEYAGIRLRLATEIAQKIEGARSRRFNAFRQQLLRMMDNVYQWTDQEWKKSEPDLADTVSKYLNIRPDADPAPSGGVLSYERYRGLLRSPRTPALLREMLQASGGVAPSTSE